MATMILSDLGAEVIKIESKSRVDLMRLRHALKDGKVDWDKANSVPIFHWINRGKRSFGVNLKEAEGLELVKDLVRKSDAVVDNLRAGVIDRLGLSDEVLALLNPRLVRLSVSAAGRTGELAGMRAYAASTSALAGLEGSVGYPTDPTQPIGMLTFGLADYTAGAMAAFALIAALHHSDPPRYQSIDANQVEANMLGLGAGFAALTAGLPTRMGNDHPLFCPSGIYRASDGAFVAVSVQTDAEWARLAELLSPHDSTLGERQDRLQRRAEVDAMVARWIGASRRDEAVSVLKGIRLRVAPVLTMPERLAHSLFTDRRTDGLLDFKGEQVPLPRTPWLVPGTPTPVDAQERSRGPNIAEDTRYVCSEILGLPEAEITRLADDGVIDLVDEC